MARFGIDAVKFWVNPKIYKNNRVTMKLQLIPVFELEYSHPKIKFPEFPFTDEEYENYFDQVYKLNGFVDKFQPIAQGFNLYSVLQTTERNLLKILKDAIQKNKNSLEGGFALCDISNGINPILTQRCCSDFNDVDSWINLAENKLKGFWIGHPMLCCKIDNDQIQFIEEEEEELEDIYVSFSEFQKAVLQLKQELPKIREYILIVANKYQLDLSVVNQFLKFTQIDQNNA